MGILGEVLSFGSVSCLMRIFQSVVEVKTDNYMYKWYEEFLPINPRSVLHNERVKLTDSKLISIK